MQDLTFNDLPSAVAEILQKLNAIEKLLNSSINQPGGGSNTMMDVKEAADYLRLTVSTVYKLTSTREIPVMKRFNRCYFLKEDLTNYLLGGRIKTIAEIEQEAEQYLINNRRNRRILR